MMGTQKRQIDIALGVAAAISVKAGDVLGWVEGKAGTLCSSTTQSPVLSRTFSAANGDAAAGQSLTFSTMTSPRSFAVSATIQVETFAFEHRGEGIYDLSGSIPTSGVYSLSTKLNGQALGGECENCESSPVTQWINATSLSTKNSFASLKSSAFVAGGVLPVAITLRDANENAVEAVDTSDELRWTIAGPTMSSGTIAASAQACMPGSEAQRKTTVCHGATGTVQCALNEEIRIVGYAYGRSSSSATCSTLGLGSCAGFPSCTSPSLYPLASKCNGLSSCAVSATDAVFGFYCAGMQPYLEVDYVCKVVRPCTGHQTESISLPTQAGSYRLSVAVNSAPLRVVTADFAGPLVVGDSKQRHLDLRVVPQTQVSALESSVFGDGLAFAAAGEVQPFTVAARDQYSNTIVDALSRTSMSMTRKDGNSNPAEGSIRQEASGLVEIYRSGVWGSVCAVAAGASSPEQATTATVVCRQLGYADPSNSTFSTLNSIANVKLTTSSDGALCDGTEKRMVDCRNRIVTWGVADGCTAAIAVSCNGKQSPFLGESQDASGMVQATYRATTSGDYAVSLFFCRLLSVELALVLLRAHAELISFPPLLCLSPPHPPPPPPPPPPPTPLSRSHLSGHGSRATP